MKNNIEEEQKVFNSIVYPINKKTKKKKKQLSKNSKKIDFFRSAVLICFSLFFFILCLHFKLIIKIIINKNKEVQTNKIYDEFAKKLFLENKTISFDYLDEHFYGIKRNYSNFDNIHILFAFNNEYYLLASVTIISILKTANDNSFIHIHIIASKGFEYETMKKLNSLKGKINNNVEFIFYDGSKAEEDFGSQIKNESYGVGEYAKLLGSVLVDEEIDRIIALDAGDCLIQKDLLELYNYPLDDYLVRGTIDPLAPCFPDWDIFFLKEGYINAGVYLYNLKKWRELDIYDDIIKFYKYVFKFYK